MKAMFVNGRNTPYPKWIAQRWKTIETRNKNMLSALVGERVAIAETGVANCPMVIGYVDVVGSFFCEAEEFGNYRSLTMIPKGDEFDCKGKGKWFYLLDNAEECEPFPVPSSAIRHGRSWCEW